MVSIEDAQGIILQYAAPLPVEEVPLLQGLARVLASDIHSPFDIPLTDNSAMDGYAFSFGSLRGDRLAVSGFVAAGHAMRDPVPPGTAVKIMTGACMPPGCDTVVPVEETKPLPGEIRLTAPVRQGSHIRRRGEDVKAGTRVIAGGSVIRPQETAMMASLGMSKAAVFRKPMAAILATGDELLPLGEAPVPGQIVNSNSIAIAAQITEARAKPVDLGIAPDDFEATKNRIRQALSEADLLVTTGGVSVGDKDYVKVAIEELGGRIIFWKVNMKPGKPVAFAVLDGKPVFALPGNPVAAMVGFEMFVRPALLKMAGGSRIMRPVISACLKSPLANKGERPQLVRALVALEDGKQRVAVTANQGSANILSLVQSNGLLKLPAATALAAGDAAEVILLDREYFDERCISPGKTAPSSPQPSP
ncbi:MAG TPA: gephyrin-like molybdotransferase Glp [Geomonas sp.]|nr:gephyrin-like molybdotransferase Glp [Geomonas sp.]